jgi:hypothetical protein
MSSYIALHVLFGVVAGVVFNYLRSVRHLTRTKAWLGYLTGIGVCLGIAALIGELSLQWQVADIYKWIGAGAVLLSFLGTISISKIASRMKDAGSKTDGWDIEEK